MSPRKNAGVAVQHIVRPGTGDIGQARALCDSRKVVTIHSTPFKTCPKCDAVSEARARARARKAKRANTGAKAREEPSSAKLMCVFRRDGKTVDVIADQHGLTVIDVGHLLADKPARWALHAYMTEILSKWGRAIENVVLHPAPEHE